MVRRLITEAACARVCAATAKTAVVQRSLLIKLAWLAYKASIYVAIDRFFINRAEQSSQHRIMDYTAFNRSRLCKSGAPAHHNDKNASGWHTAHATLTHPQSHPPWQDCALGTQSSIAPSRHELRQRRDRQVSRQHREARDRRACNERQQTVQPTL